MNNLSEFIGHTSLEYVDLSENKSTPWGLYCTIIKCSCINSLITLCGDKGMKQYAKDIADSLQGSLTFKSLTVCKIGSIGMKLIENILVNNTTLNKLNLSWGVNANGTELMKRKLKPATHKANEMYVNILYDDDHECLSNTINLSEKHVDDDAVYVIAFGLYNNMTVEKLDLSLNDISEKGMKQLSKYITQAISLQYVDLSGNKSSPWSVYCAMIRHCCVESLTLCGDEGMQTCVKEVTDSLQVNTTLQSLMLCKFGRIGLESIKDVLDNNTTLKELHLSWMSKGSKIIHRKLPQNKVRLDSNSHEVVDINILYDGDHQCSSEVITMSNKDINDDAVHLISFGLLNNTITFLDLSRNNITNDGARAISDCFRSNCYLHVLILSENSIFYEGAKRISELIQVNKSIWKLDISHNSIQDNGAIEISKSLKANNTLQELNLSDNQITSKGAKKIAEAIRVNIGLQKLDVSQNAIHDDGAMYISASLKENSTLLELSLSKNEINTKGGKIIAKAIQKNTSLEKLDLSHNNISDNGVTVINDYLKGNNALKKLNLSNTDVSEESLKIIALAIHSGTTEV